MEPVIKCLFFTTLIISLLNLFEAQCPSNLMNETLYIADPENCQNYWMCNSTAQMEMKCPTDHCFDSSTNECTYKGSNNCDGHDGDLYPDCDNCTRYWQCSNGIRTHMICPNYPKLWYNFEKKQCDYIRNYPDLHGCGDIRCTTGPDRRQYAVDNDKRKFVWCIKGKAYLYKCCEDNETCHFDVNQQLCDFAPDADTNNFINKEHEMPNYKNEVVEPNPYVCGSSPPEKIRTRNKQLNNS